MIELTYVAIGLWALKRGAETGLKRFYVCAVGLCVVPWLPWPNPFQLWLVGGVMAVVSFWPLAPPDGRSRR